jgi:glycerophosphoryl diester phosphodiesterase
MIFALAAALAATIFLAVRSYRHKPRNFAKYFAGFKPMVATHRGHGKMGAVAENTLAAFKASEKLGFRAHELDVRLTHDKKVVLLHGPTLEHTTNGKGRVEERTYHEIAGLNAAHYLNTSGSSNKNQRQAHEKLPLLSEVLRNIQKTSLVNVEIKRDRFDFNTKLEPLVDQVVHETGTAPRVCYSGFHFLTLWHMKNTGTKCPVGLLIEPGIFARLKCWLYRHVLLPDNIHLHHSTATANLLQSLKRRGYGIAIWTVNDATRARELFAHGADMVITDNMNFVRDFAAGRPSRAPAREQIITN